MHISILLVLLSFGAEAFANNFFIPNHYRNRRSPNQGSAIGWSDRKEVNLGYGMSATKESRDGVKQSENESTDLDALVFYRTPVNLNIEAGVRLVDTELKSPGAATDTGELQSGLLSLGYEFSEAPMVITALYQGVDSDSKYGATGATSSTETQTLGLGYGYRVGSNTYLGASFAQLDIDYARSEDEKAHYYFLGGGQIFGDQVEPLGGYEAILGFWNEDHTQSYDLSLRGFYNLGGMQYYGLVNYETRSGDRDGYSYGGSVGADLQVSSFFVGPELSYDYYRSESGTSRRTDTDMNAALIAGFRNLSFELAIEYAIETNEEDNSAGISNDESEGDTWTLSAAAFF